MSRSHGFFALAACALAVMMFAGCDSHDDVVVAPPQDTVPPAAPQALYSVTGDGKVTLHWVKNTEPDLAGYRVYVAPAYPGPYNPITTTGATTFVVNGLTNGTTSFFAVAAYDARATRAICRSRTSTTRRARPARTSRSHPSRPSRTQRRGSTSPPTRRGSRAIPRPTSISSSAGAPGSWSPRTR
jgi:hypothetical protein